MMTILKSDLQLPFHCTCYTGHVRRLRKFSDLIYSLTRFDLCNIIYVMFIIYSIVVLEY